MRGYYLGQNRGTRGETVLEDIMIRCPFRSSPVLGPKNLWPYPGWKFSKEGGRASISTAVCIDVLICLTKVPGVGGREALTCSICSFLWYKCCYHDQFQATNTMSLNTELGRDVQSAFLSQDEPAPGLRWLWHSFSFKLWSLGWEFRDGIFRK